MRAAPPLRHARSLHEFLSNLANPDEADVECLCNLLKTIGKQVRRRRSRALAPPVAAQC